MKLDNPKVDVVLLDDAYQHRHVKAGLEDTRRPIFTGCLGPHPASGRTIAWTGRWQKPGAYRDRNQMSGSIKPIYFNIITKRLKLYPYQQLYFSSFRYGALTPLFGKKRRTLTSLEKYWTSVAGYRNRFACTLGGNWKRIRRMWTYASLTITMISVTRICKLHQGTLWASGR